jgi:hypothetical protein
MKVRVQYTVNKIDLILHSIERIPKKQFSMARKFMLQPLHVKRKAYRKILTNIILRLTRYTCRKLDNTKTQLCIASEKDTDRFMGTLYCQELLGPHCTPCSTYIGVQAVILTHGGRQEQSPALVPSPLRVFFLIFFFLTVYFNKQ